MKLDRKEAINIFLDKKNYFSLFSIFPSFPIRKLTDETIINFMSEIVWTSGCIQICMSDYVLEYL